MLFEVCLHAQQLRLEQESSGGELDCPPGFELPTMASNECPPSPLVSSCSFEGEKSSRRNLLSIGQTYDDMEYILGGIEHDLHSSAMTALVQYFEAIVDEKVKQILGSLEDDQFNEVVSRNHF